MILRSIIFFIGWLLSPFTWWNDVFVNILLSYLMANILVWFIPLPFGWLVMGSYWFTNILGLALMYLSGRRTALSKKERLKTIILSAVFILIYSLCIYYLDRHQKLIPIIWR